LREKLTGSGEARGVRQDPSIPAPAGGPAFDPARLGTLREEIGAETAQQLIEVFLADAGTRLQAMRALVARHERKALERAAHSLKSSAGAFGFVRLADLAREIETAAATPAAPLGALVEAAAAALAGGERAWRSTD
jgi:HPt (histidine-containing phosphotransfer) domain-containing protein